MTTASSSQRSPKLTKEQVLRLSMKGRLDHYHEIRVKHPRVNDALADLKLLAKTGSGTDITLLIGPTGVGKSTVVDALGKEIITEKAEEMERDKALIPFVAMEAPASGERGFSWRIFYQRLCEGLQEPLIQKKQETVSRDGRLMVRPATSHAMLSALRISVEDALRSRKTGVVVVDEAAHLLRNTQGNTLENHMDALKSLANICGVNLIMVGAYDMTKLMKLSGQVARRTSIIHFQRYLTGSEILAGLGVTPVEAFPNNSQEVHHLRINITRPSLGSLKLALSLTRLTVETATNASSKKPMELNSWAFELLPVPTPTAALKNELRNALRDLIASPDTASR